MRLRLHRGLHALRPLLVEGLAQVERVGHRVEHRLGRHVGLARVQRGRELDVVGAELARERRATPRSRGRGPGRGLSRGVSSCSAAVSTPIFMNFGANVFTAGEPAAWFSATSALVDIGITSWRAAARSWDSRPRTAALRAGGSCHERTRTKSAW